MRKPRAAIRALYLAIVLLLTLGFSKIGKAAQRVKRLAKGTKGTLRSSYLSYLTARAWGYFVPAWGGVDTSELPPARAEREGIIDDPDRKVEREFRVRSDLKARVAFWIEVYSRFSTQYRIVHDRDNPGLVYGYVDLRALYRGLPRRMADSRAQQLEERVVKELKARISEAMGITSPPKPQLTAQETDSIRRLMRGFGASTPEAAAQLLSRMRTQSGQRDIFLTAIKRSRPLLPQIEQTFREHGLPLALARLPFVESMFNPRAVSKVGALGMWQFMPDTARLYDRRGTRRDWTNPIRQSRSAAKYLASLKQKLSDWSIAITAYNSGAARLDRLVKRYHATDIADLIAVPSARDTLGFAGKNFFCELLAANLVEAYQDKLFSPHDGITRRTQSLGRARPKAKPRAVPARDVSSLAHRQTKAPARDKRRARAQAIRVTSRRANRRR